MPQLDILHLVLRHFHDVRFKILRRWPSHLVSRHGEGTLTNSRHCCIARASRNSEEVGRKPCDAQKMRECGITGVAGHKTTRLTHLAVAQTCRCPTNSTRLRL